MKMLLESQYEIGLMSPMQRMIGWTPHADIRRGLRELLAHEQMLQEPSIRDDQ